MTLDEARKLSPGTLIRLKENYSGLLAAAGATAIINSVDCYIRITWIRDGLDHCQHDGGYYPDDFELYDTKIQLETQPVDGIQSGAEEVSALIIICNCSTFDFAHFGCRYLRTPDSQGYIHS